MNRLQYFLKFIHGEKAKTIDYLLIHIFPFVAALIFMLIRHELFLSVSPLLLFFYFILMWELLGGFIAMLLKSTKLFWQMQPLKYKFYYVLLHSWHGIFWFMILKVDIRFCAVYFLYLASSTILLLKIKASVVNVVALLLTFGGLILCNYMENFYSPFPFGFEWVVYLLYLKLIFAFTINYKIYDA